MNTNPSGQNDGDYLQISLDRLFDNFELNDSNEKDVIRLVVELTFFENRIRGLRGLRGSLPKVLCRIRQILLLGQDQELPKQFEKRAHNELSSLGHWPEEAGEVVFQYLVAREKKDLFFSREKRKMSLPITAFTGETKKRIFHFFSGVIREELQEIQEMRSQLTYPDKLIKPLNDMLQELARRFNVRESVDEAEKLVFLRASLSEAKAHYNNLKEQLQDALQSEDTARLENRLKKAQNQVSILASEIQKLEQKRKGISP